MVFEYQTSNLEGSSYPPSYIVSQFPLHCQETNFVLNLPTKALCQSALCHSFQHWQGEAQVLSDSFILLSAYSDLAEFSSLLTRKLQWMGRWLLFEVIFSKCVSKRNFLMARRHRRNLEKYMIWLTMLENPIQFWASGVNCRHDKCVWQATHAAIVNNHSFVWHVCSIYPLPKS